MSLAHVVNAVTARLAAGWARCPIRVANDTDGDTPSEDEPFLEVQYPATNSAQITVGSPGSNLYRDEGAVLLVLAVVRGRGLNEALAWIDELAVLFRGKTFDGVRTYAPSAPVIDDRNDEGRYFLLSIAVPFEHDYLG